MTPRFTETATTIAGVVDVVRHPIGDTRGWLERVFCCSELAVWGNRPIAQVNRTFTNRRGTLRGLHVQPACHAEAKYVCCLRGAVYDVALDLRLGSPSYGQWHGKILSAETHNALFMAEGFAHGFQAMTDDVEMLYFHSATYAPEAETGIDALDPALAIRWPLPDCLRSDRDRRLPRIADFDPEHMPAFDVNPRP